MSGDPEIEAMIAVVNALAGIEDDAKVRVIRWVAERFDLEVGPQVDGERRGRNGANGAGHWQGSLDRTSGHYTEFVDLFDAANPKTDTERALVGGFWFQNVQGASDFQSQDVNTALKDVGHGVGNITQALTKLQQRKPALVRQVMKSGKTQQARKKYKLTAAGVSEVRRMLTGRSDGDE
jgi:hypothetical protein